MNVNYTSIEQVRDQIKNNTKRSSTSQGYDSTNSFDEILFSKHASERLAKRNIDMSPEQEARLKDATTQAREKGMKESLVMVDNLAFIVNVKNNTVVTAVNDTKNAVFTNIDGVVFN